MVGVSRDKEFRVVWQKSTGGRWYVRVIPASSLEEALEKLLGQLRTKLRLKDSEFHVDHFIQEFGSDGQQKALHTLTDRPRAFQVHFNNKVWPAGATIDRHA